MECAIKMSSLIETNKRFPTDTSIIGNHPVFVNDFRGMRAAGQKNAGSGDDPAVLNRHRAPRLTGNARIVRDEHHRFPLSIQAAQDPHHLRA